MPNYSKIRLKTEDENFNDLLGNGKKYIVPKFQRDYSWQKEQLEDFWEDTNHLQENDYHYMGYLVLQQTEKQTFQIIDGQQRITTFSLMILAAIQILGERGEEERARRLRESYIGQKDIVTLALNNKLTLNKNNNLEYRRAVELRPLPKRNTKQTIHRMRKAIDFFYDKWQKKTTLEIVEIIEATGIDLLFTSIYVSDEINAYQVFETLNSRGVKLSSGDLLKNYIFSLMDKENDLTTEFIIDLEEKWETIGERIQKEEYSKFIWSHWNSSHSLIRQNNLFREIKKNINDNQKAEDYLESLYESSSVYGALKNPDNEFWKEEGNYLEIKKAIHFLNLFQIKQPISLLLAVYNNQREYFLQVLKWIVIFSFRYNVICRMHTGEQEKLYNEICLLIERNSSQNSQGIRAKIKEKILTLYPNDKTFKTNFQDKNFPTYQSNKKASYVLARLIEKKNNQLIQEQDLTLEHILPLETNEEWQEHFGENHRTYRERLGNMALVTSAENKELARKNFNEKKEILENSTYKDFNSIEAYGEWTAEMIEHRQNKMAELAASTWKID